MKNNGKWDIIIFAAIMVLGIFVIVFLLSCHEEKEEEQIYLVVKESVIEIRNGEKISIEASLESSKEIKSKDYAWKLGESDGVADRIEIIPVQDVCVVKGIEKGWQKITVSNPLAKNTVEIVIFVLE